MPGLYNLARMTTATTGTGTITLGSAVGSYLTFAQAGASNGETVTYAITDGANREIGRGVYTSSGTTLTRTVLKSTNNNAAISLSGTAEVMITAAAEDFADRQDALPNILINGDFQINQRGFAGGALAANAYGFDRWKGGVSGGNVTLSGLVATLVSGTISQVVEPSTASLLSFAGLPVTISVDGPSRDISVVWGTASGTITAGSGRRGVTLTSSASGDTTLTLSNASGLSFTFGRVKAELGSLATAWQERPLPLELSLCQRYFSKSMRQGTTPAQGAVVSTDCVFGVGGAFTATQAHAAFCYFPVTMRAVPTITFYRSNLGSVNGRWQYPDIGVWYDSTGTLVVAGTQNGFLAQLAGTFTTGFALAVVGGWTASAEL